MALSDRIEAFEQYDDFVASLQFYPAKYRILYPALKLAGEAGEVAEKIGKQIRDKNADFSPEDFREALLKELGDVLWYITAIAADLRFNLQDVVDANVAKLRDREKRGVLGGEGDNR